MNGVHFLKSLNTASVSWKGMIRFSYFWKSGSGVMIVIDDFFFCSSVTTPLSATENGRKEIFQNGFLVVFDKLEVGFVKRPFARPVTPESHLKIHIPMLIQIYQQNHSMSYQYQSILKIHSNIYLCRYSTRFYQHKYDLHKLLY